MSAAAVLPLHPSHTLAWDAWPAQQNPGSFTVFGAPLQALEEGEIRE